MKWKFGFLSQAQLRLMILLSMGMSCKKNEPSDPPDSFIWDATSATIDSSCTKEASKSTANQPCDPFWSQLPEGYKNSKDLAALLKDIGWQKDLILKDGQDQSSRPTASRLPNRLFIFFERDRKDGAWYERTPLEPESIAVKFNPIMPNSDKHSYTLIGFVANIQATSLSQAHLIVFVHSDQKWFCYNNNGTKTAFATQEAMHLASKQGTTFFYRKNR